MSQQLLANLCLGLDVLGLIAYAVLGGADFGAGVWDLLAVGPFAKQQRSALAHAIGPVWEANNVWLVFVIVVTWTAFPIVYAALSEVLIIPLGLVLVGIIFRGAAYAFRWQYGGQGRLWGAWERVFSIASTITPFMLGTVAGAIAGGDIHVHGRTVIANVWTPWLTPFALACGLFAVGLCAVLAATYLTVEARNAGDQQLVQAFQPRAIVAGAVTAAFGAIAALLAHSESPVLWDGLIGKALPLSLGAVLIGLATAFTLLNGNFRFARILVAGETACILAAWGVAQYPYLIIPDVTISSAASPPITLSLLLILSVAGLAILLPSLWYLFRVFKSAHPRQPGLTVAAFVETLGPVDMGTGSVSESRPARRGRGGENAMLAVDAVADAEDAQATGKTSVVPGVILLAIALALAVFRVEWWRRRPD
jgi:cytochrome bd ubiquinol oxidase subunit II